MLATQRMYPPNPLLAANHAGAALPLVPRRLSRESSAASTVPIRVLINQSSPPLAFADSDSDSGSSSDSNAPPTISLRPNQTDLRPPLLYSPGVSLRLTTARNFSESHAPSCSTPSTSTLTGPSTSSFLPVSQSQPRLIRKKSGQLVKSSLKTSKSLSLLTPRSPYTNSKSEPATPTHTPKAVHFDSQLEHVKLFLAEQKPLAVSRDGSPTEDTASGTDTDFPDWIYGSPSPSMGSHRTVTMHTLNMPVVLPPTTPDLTPVVLESLTLSQAAAAPAVQGRVRVANLAFTKSVVARFTFDAWQTTSEVSARYVSSSPDSGTDVFVFTVRLNDLLARIEGKRMLLAVRYCVLGREVWDNNFGRDFHVEFGMEGHGVKPSSSAPAPVSIAISKSTPSLSTLASNRPTPNTPSPSPVQTDTEADGEGDQEEEEATWEGEYYDLRPTPDARTIASLRSTLEKVVPLAPAPVPISVPFPTTTSRAPPPPPISTTSSSPSSSSLSSYASTTPGSGFGFGKLGFGSAVMPTHWGLSPAPHPHNVTHTKTHTRSQSYPAHSASASASASASPVTPRTFLHPHPHAPFPSAATTTGGAPRITVQWPVHTRARKEWERVSAHTELRWTTLSKNATTNAPASRWTPPGGQPRALGSPRDADGDVSSFIENSGSGTGSGGGGEVGAGVGGPGRRHRRGYFHLEGLPEPSICMAGALDGKVFVRRTPPGSPVGAGVGSGSGSGEEGDKSEEDDDDEHRDGDGDGDGDGEDTPMPGRLFSFPSTGTGSSIATTMATSTSTAGQTHGLGLLRPPPPSTTPTTIGEIKTTTTPTTTNRTHLLEEDSSEVSTPSLGSPSTSPSPSPSPVESDTLLTDTDTEGDVDVDDIDTDGTETEGELGGKVKAKANRRPRPRGGYKEFLSRFCFFTGTGTGTGVTGIDAGPGNGTGIPGLLGADSPTSTSSSLFSSPISPIQDVGVTYSYTGHAHLRVQTHPHAHSHSRVHGHAYTTQTQTETQKLFVVPSPPAAIPPQSQISGSAASLPSSVIVPRTQSAGEIEGPRLGHQANQAMGMRSPSFDRLFSTSTGVSASEGGGEDTPTPTPTPSRSSTLTRR